MELLHRQGDGVDLLDELGAQGLGQGPAARARDEDAQALGGDVRERLSDAHQEVEHALRLARVVALVVVPEDLAALGVHDGGLHRRRAHVHADHERLFHAFDPPRWLMVTSVSAFLRSRQPPIRPVT